MSYSFIQDVPIDENQYQEVRAAIGPDTPKGLIAHLVIRQDAGLRYIDVWDTQADWERFRDERVTPAVQRMMAAHGLPAPTSPAPNQSIEVIDTWVG